MKTFRSKASCTLNDRWYEMYGKDGYFCLPRSLLFNLVGQIDNATMYVYVALASCHFEGNTTFPGSAHLSSLTGKDESSVRGHLADLETLGLIRREPRGRGYRVIFQCPDRVRIKEGARKICTYKNTRKKVRKEAADQRSLRSK